MEFKSLRSKIISEIKSSRDLLLVKTVKGFSDKLHYFEKLNFIEDRITFNTFHVWLNFDPSEKINIEKLQGIANGYMERIGFEKQPYLVY